MEYLNTLGWNSSMLLMIIINSILRLISKKTKLILARNRLLSGGFAAFGGAAVANISTTLWAPTANKNYKGAQSENHTLWKLKMEDLLCSRGLWCIVQDELRFHINSDGESSSAWKKLENVFVKVHDARYLQLERRLLKLSANDFDQIEDFISKLKELRHQVVECGHKKSDKHMVFIILQSLPEAYEVLVFTFPSTKSMFGKIFEEPSLDELCTLLIGEQDKLMLMGRLRSKKKAYVAKSKPKKQKDPKSNPKPQESL
eukprot:Gb_23557 [translate_table: standard]